MSASGPVLEGTGNTIAGVSVGTNGLTFHGANAIAEWLGVIGGTSYWPRSRHDELLDESGSSIRHPDVRRYGHSHLYAELGAGPLLVLDERLDWRLEVFLGAGIGRSTGQLDIPDTTHVMDITGSFFAPFLQVDVGRIPNAIVDYAFVTRFVDLQYEFHSVDGAPVHAHRSLPLLQFAHSVRVGWKNIKAEFQFGIDAMPTKQDALPYAVSIDPVYVSLGLLGRFGGTPPLRWKTRPRRSR